ncbi:2OG-Fe(II) oxygenase [Shewanella sp. WXL01]|uniref:2OG-Fe(II) oxygenase n=1 Tax=Shewanella maritima TaxID=2520507 RepID=A0A411PD98_9GAMM|nr:MULTISPECIES: 2OG-Fe(II) oxygenase [Shewanella]NKF50418.1 2OG-Fe(II) oxygenase [Shewanella sp. WXL01]QBF81577.1 2OG-Fe(II) oxygenase [Shewanella maritima]
MDFIEVYPNALPETLCNSLIQVLDTHPAVTQGKTGNGVDLEKKHSRDLTMDSVAELTQLKNEILQVTFKYAVEYFKRYPLALMGAVAVNVNDEQGNPTTLTPDNFERLGLPRIEAIVKYLFRSGAVNLQHYQQGVGGYPHWHSEQFPQLPHNEPLHRVALFMFYLNDVKQGGETEFFYQNKQIKPQKGTMVIAPASFTHSHRGNTPLSNDKYIVTSWLMFNRAEQLYARND